MLKPAFAKPRSWSFLSIILVLSTVLLGLSSCSKTEKVYENKVIGGNEPPPYLGVSRIQIKNYINGMYIDFVGDEPTDAVLEAATDLLIANELEEATRETIILDILADTSHKQRLWDLTSVRCLNGFSYQQVDLEKQQAEYLSDFSKTMGDTLLSYLFDKQVSQFSALLDAKDDLESGSIGLGEYYSLFCYNAVYDEINMGSENFVLGVFEDLLFRAPTTIELFNSVAMADGTPGTLFLQDGDTKPNFLEILTSNEEFFQGFIIDAFQLLLARQPTSVEMNDLGTELFTSGDYKDIYLEIAKSEEYAGF